MMYVLSLLKEIIRKRRLIWDLAKADFRKRFVGSYFGVDDCTADCDGHDLFLHLPAWI